MRKLACEGGLLIGCDVILRGSSVECFAAKPRYVWKDDGEELEVLLDVPESTSKRDVT